MSQLERIRNRTRKEIDAQEAEFARVRDSMGALGRAAPMGTLVVGAHDHDGLTDWIISCAHGYTEATTTYSLNPSAQLENIKDGHRIAHAEKGALCLCEPVPGMTIEP